MRKQPFLSLLSMFLVLALLSACKQERLPKFYAQGIGDKGWDTIYQTIPAFVSINQQGDTVGLADIDSTIRLVDFFVIGCDDPCEAMRTALSQYQDADIKRISITLNPAQDTVEALQAYASQHQIQAPQWHLLRMLDGRSRYFSEKVFHARVREDTNVPGGLRPSRRVVLIDKEGRTRGRYELTQATEQKRLRKELDILKQEYIPRKPWWKF